MDPDNPVVKLCVEGMKAEADGKPEEALLLFMRAWEQSKEDYEACIAAHYVARHQKTSSDVLRWNQASLDRADAVGDERVAGFYPSLYLNMGKAYEDFGNLQQAKTYYELASARIDNLPPGPYSEVVRKGISRGLERVS